MLSLRGIEFMKCLDRIARKVTVTDVKQLSQDASKENKEAGPAKKADKLPDAKDAAKVPDAKDAAKVPDAKQCPIKHDDQAAQANAKLSNDPPKGMLTNTKTEYGPLKDCDRIFQNLYGRHDWRLKGACKRGDWYRTADLLEMGPDWIIEEVKKSGVRGRGRSGFYAANKWSSLKEVKAKDKVLILNCSEGEPGTCKDREILRHEPHKLIEGCLLAGYTMGCEKCIVYCRNRFYNEACNLQYALAEAYRYGLLGCNACDLGIKFDMHIQRGDKYLTGEETALVNCLMGELGRPRSCPPYLHEKGYFGHPSLVLNAESIAVVPTILRRGAKWWTGLGRNNNFGTKLFNISGHVNNPCTVEEEMSMPLRDVIEMHAGGVCGGWNNLLAVFPGGLSTPLISKITAEEVLMDFDCLESVGSQMGTGGIIVICADSDPLMIMQRSIEFYMKATCKQCTNCRDAAVWFPQIFKNFTKGESHPQMIDFLDCMQQEIRGTCICSVAESQANMAKNLVYQFAPVIEQRILEFGKDY